MTDHPVTRRLSKTLNSVKKSVCQIRDEDMVRSRLASIGHLLSGSMFNALLMLLAVMIAARALGSAEFGIMALVLSVGRICERFVRFESWQPLIKFAADEETAGDVDRLAALYLYGLLLDIAAALAAALITLVAGYFLLSLLGFKPEHYVLIAIYALAIATNIRGMPTAALRMDGCFRTIAYLQLIANSLRLMLAAGCYFGGLGLAGFIIVWTFAQIFDAALFNYSGFRSLRKNGVSGLHRVPWRGLQAKFPGFISFAWSTNLSSTLRTMTHEADTVLVGIFVGPAGAGFFHLAKRMAKVAQQMGAHIQTVIYPDIARLWAKEDRKAVRRITARIQMVLAAAGFAVLAICWAVGESVIQLAFGDQYMDVSPLLTAQLVAVFLILHAAPARSSLLAMNRPGYVLAVALLATPIFFAVALYAAPLLGAIGVSFAHIAFAAFTAIALDIGWKRWSSDKVVPDEVVPVD